MYIETGNPIYPFLNNIFHSPNVDPYFYSNLSHYAARVTPSALMYYLRDLTVGTTKLNYSAGGEETVEVVGSTRKLFRQKGTDKAAQARLSASSGNRCDQPGPAD